jgi:hypothetical protein
MAIDSRAKRISAYIDTCGILWPDGTIDAADRQTLLGEYGESGPSPVLGDATDIVRVEPNTGGSANRGVVRVGL